MTSLLIQRPRVGERRRQALWVACVVAFLGGRFVLGAQPPVGSGPTGGQYADLSAVQQRLFGGVLQRYNSIARTRYTPSAAYDALPPSRRTTFEAVTNALATTTLSDASEAPLGTALDLVEGIDEILGELRGARGDRQFRLYVLLAPDTVDRLARSREFVRTADNTIYHPGYPVSFRLRGGAPSIQVSMSRDGRRGDIDVDYRSSRFPAALVNGHLTSANSDVRAGGNYDRHQRRWSGLGNWWQRFLALFAAPQPAVTEPRTGIIPVQPRLPASAGIDAVVEDFLTAWLVERKAELSAAYFSPLSFACIEPRGNAPAGPGLERYVILERMKAANEAIGAATSLQQVSISVNPWDSRLQVQPHRRGAAFLLARVPPDLAAAYDCANRGEGSSPTLSFTEYYASALRLRVPGGPAPALVLLWAREASGFRIVGVDVEEAAEPTVPIGGPHGSIFALSRARRVPGPSSLIEAATTFHRAWFLDRDVDRALSYFDEASFGCLPDVSDGAMPGDRDSMRTMLGEVSARAASRAALASAIRTVEPTQPGVEVVDHAGQQAFTVVPVSDPFVDAVTCGAELPVPAGAGPASGATRGNRGFVSYFQLNLPGDPAFIWMLWKPGADGWRVSYWTIVTP